MHMPCLPNYINLNLHEHLTYIICFPIASRYFIKKKEKKEKKRYKLFHYESVKEEKNY